MLVADAKALNRTLKAQWGKFEITAQPSLSAALGNERFDFSR